MTPATAAAWPLSLSSAASGANQFKNEFRWVLLACWMLSATCISFGRPTVPLEFGAFDRVAIAKTILRGLALLISVAVLLRLNFHPRALPVLRPLIPFGVFSIWAAVSFLWSPMKIVTLGHAVELIALVCLAVCCGVLVDSDIRRSALCLHLLLPLVLIAGFVLAAEARTIWYGQRPIGYMHPNALGGLAVTALILLLACRFFWRWPWTQWLIAPGSAICVIAIYAARSRSALLGAVLVGVPLLWIARRRSLLVALLAGGGAVLALFPYSRSIERIPTSVQSYVLRGQTTGDLAGGSGRDELWARALECFKQSPLLGSGYFMISPTGTLYVWLKLQYQTAHNLYLHVLTGTGILGALLFAWACAAALGPSMRRAWESPQPADILLLLLAAWFALVGFSELSILGPVDPAGVLFFAILGASVCPIQAGQPWEGKLCAS